MNKAQLATDRAVKTVTPRHGATHVRRVSPEEAPDKGKTGRSAGSDSRPLVDEAPAGRKKEVTQAKILDAAVSLFKKRGFERTSISAVATRAGVSRATVFWHFGDKQHLFQEACRLLLRPFIEQLEKSLGESDPRQRLFALFSVYENFVAENRPTIETVVRWVLESPALRSALVQPLLSLHDAFARDVRETIEKLDGNGQYASTLAAGLVSLLDGNLLLSLLDSNRTSQARRRAGLLVLTEAALDRLPGSDDSGAG
jgi:AcrR family transcriptional regulator